MNAAVRLPGSAVLLRGDAAALPLPDASVDLVVTSPPYWQQRVYEDGGAAYAGQIGLEPTPRAYIDALTACTREWLRVLKPHGSIFVNLGDKYSDRAEGPASSRSFRSDRGDVCPSGPNSIDAAPRKSLLLLPERYRIAALDELRVIVREVLIWSKPNGMPESVRDRCRRAHEDWVHLQARPDAFAALDRLRQPHARAWSGKNGGRTSMIARSDDRDTGLVDSSPHPLGALPGDVWNIPTEPLVIPPRVAHQRCCGGRPVPGCARGLDHFAAFPLAWPHRLIAGYCPTGTCTACGQPRRPAVDRGRVADRKGRQQHRAGDRITRAHGDAGRAGNRYTTANVIRGEECGCDEPTAPADPAVVLDPFGGTGTVALVAAAMGRIGISIDRSRDYGRLAEWRTTDPKERHRALRMADPSVPPPRRDRGPKPTPGADALFEIGAR